MTEAAVVNKTETTVQKMGFKNFFIVKTPFTNALAYHIQCIIGMEFFTVLAEGRCGAFTVLKA